ncbi:MAG: hybrid sensor histidine kinase/response regulator [Methanoregula sp.]|nr:hybrid sensor histidine kinase/response regulator [Methanoregula sp.]
MLEVLCVDKNPVLLESFMHFLERDKNIHAESASSAEEALERMSTVIVDAIITDYDLPGSDGVQFLKKVREKYPGIPFIFFTGTIREEIVIEALNYGADYFIRKGHDPESRFAELSEALMRKYRSENARVISRKNLTMFSGMIRHDILNQLMIISGSLELASDGIQEPGLLKNLTRAQSAAKTIQQQITFSRHYENLGAGFPEWQPVKSVIRQAFLELQHEGITLRLPEDTTEIFADPLFEKVFFHLFSYSEKYSEGVTCIIVSYQKDSTGLIISVSDNGTGISSKERMHLFDKKPVKDTVPGLFLAEKILEVTGMSIHETGKENEGLQFKIVVPPDGFRFPKNTPS